ncbi:hypothetical protein F5Y15DRAFT_187614 [Xylariaceae sp. FL0016]|nr:hypothetical protein F5Y15DRAFT_187614 [Xylariaceae sp. FL0016]
MVVYDLMRLFLAFLYTCIVTQVGRYTRAADHSRQSIRAKFCGILNHSYGDLNLGKSNVHRPPTSCPQNAPSMHDTMYLSLC